MNSHRYAFHLLLHAADLMDEELVQRLGPLGIGPRQARVIEALGRMGAVSQAQLAREFRITQASMSTMTSRLMAGGFITRKPDPEDSRSNLLLLSASGHALLSEIDRVWNSMDEFGAQAIGHDDFDGLTCLAGRLRNALGGKRPGD